jgi:hypothetical protein
MVAPILIIMSLIDLIGALVLTTLPQRATVSILSFPVPQGLGFYIGIILLVKGTYSLAWGIIGADA